MNYPSPRVTHCGSWNFKVNKQKRVRLGSVLISFYYYHQKKTRLHVKHLSLLNSHDKGFIRDSSLSRHVNDKFKT